MIKGKSSFAFVSLFPVVAILLILILIYHPASGDSQVIQVGSFGNAGLDSRLPSGWEELFFNGIDNHTKYQLVKENSRVVVQASSHMSSSGLVRKLVVDPQSYPFIDWSWRISNVYENGDVHSKQGDDYPARIYITFAYQPEEESFFEKTKFNLAKMIYGEYPPGSAINYIWASKAGKEEVVPNPFTDRTMMIVVESGQDQAGQWLSYSRNIVEDYQLAFGRLPPPITGVAIMTDSDNTGESATSWYGDISFSKLPSLFFRKR